MLQIVASLTHNSRGIIYDSNIFTIQATGVLPCHFTLELTLGGAGCSGLTVNIKFDWRTFPSSSVRE